jgi:hypothetical protein
LGKTSTLVIESLRDQTDWCWLWDVAGGIEITPKIFEVGGFLNRCVTLAHGKRVFHEFEHIAWLHALGLRGVRFWLEGSTWPPFMCQMELWRHTKPLLLQQGPLRPYKAPAMSLPAPKGRKRSVSYRPDRAQVLLLKARVDYGGQRKGRHGTILWGGTSETNLVEVLSARTLGKPPALKPLAWTASHLPLWQEQSQKILWAPWFGQPDHAFYDELAAHKVNDGMLFTFIAPPGSFLVGTIEFDCSDHALDLKAAKWLYQQNNVVAFRKAV